MRFSSFCAHGKEIWGLIKNEGVVVVDKALASGFPTLKSAIEAGKLDEIGAALMQKKIDLPLEQANYLPVITNPDKILCVGLNFHDHRLEGGHSEVSHPT
ncbi:MAG: 5-carboxymethyl-2-hydroxymuconate isomerase, partial [Rhodospirillaceae bacterium]|nr:5-carboxymethyl-2-hydroxymuconate isomerase [Rhodospirillaceae bacterium]